MSFLFWFILGWGTVAVMHDMCKIFENHWFFFCSVLDYNFYINLCIYVVSDDVREKMKTRYLSNPDYNFEKVNRASMACGPMVKWAIAQVNIKYLYFLVYFETLKPASA